MDGRTHTHKMAFYFVGFSANIMCLSVCVRVSFCLYVCVRTCVRVCLFVYVCVSVCLFECMCASCCSSSRLLMSAVICELVSLQVMVWMLADRYTHPLIFHGIEKKKSEKSRWEFMSWPCFLSDLSSFLRVCLCETDTDSVRSWMLKSTWIQKWPCSLHLP